MVLWDNDLFDRGLVCTDKLIFRPEILEILDSLWNALNSFSPVDNINGNGQYGEF